MASRLEGAAGRDGVCLGGTCWKNQDKGVENKPEAGQKLPGEAMGQVAQELSRQEGGTLVQVGMDRAGAVPCGPGDLPGGVRGAAVHAAQGSTESHGLTNTAPDQ